MGMDEMPLLLPVSRSVSSSISFLTWSKSANLRPLACRNSAYSACLLYSSCRMSGRRVTMPEPRGKKSLWKSKRNCFWIRKKKRRKTKVCGVFQIPADKVFKHTRLASALAAHDSNLWQIDLERGAQRREGVLQLIDDWYQAFHAWIARHFLSVCLNIFLLFYFYLKETTNFLQSKS